MDLLIVTILLAVVAVAALAAMIVALRRPLAVPDAAPDRTIVELAAKVQQMGELLTQAQSQMQSHVSDRLDAVSHRLGVSMQESSLSTADNLQKLNERLAVIDSAQKNITALTSQVATLQQVLGNKQSRGAFGQGRMEAIVQDGLPKGAYAFQHTLSNGRRPDCCVFLPDKRPLVIDAKFPLEAVTAMHAANSDDERRQAAGLFRQHIGRHVADISEKYLIHGETQDVALMFVPSESIYAELHDGFDDVVQKAYRSRVVIVSPSLLMLAIQVVQQIQKDARMREAAHLIQIEVGRLLEDVARLSDRVRKLQQHSNQANEDVRQILISTDKIERRSDRIRQVELAEEGSESTAAAEEPNVIAAPAGRPEAGVR